ncbi:hypothetical protein ACQ4PT_053879 [Festuca glaucescens]
MGKESVGKDFSGFTGGVISPASERVFVEAGRRVKAEASSGEAERGEPRWGADCGGGAHGAGAGGAVAGREGWEMAAQRELSERMYAELLAAEAEMARAPPPLSDLNQEDRSELDYSDYRQSWNDKWSSQYGSFEETTPIPCMRFTDNPMPHLTCHLSTVQIFSVKVAEIAGSLQYPLDVFGTIAMCDSLDHNRNIIFCRTRDNCQSLTQQDRNLVLTGPVRAVVHEYGSVYIDAVLKVKGSTESEDKDLSLELIVSS